MQRSFASLLLPCGVIGFLGSLPLSAFVFNVVPQAALVVAPLLCKGQFVIHPSFRRSSHEYLCQVAGSPASDITFVATGLTWLLLWMVASTIAVVVWSILAARKRQSD